MEYKEIKRLMDDMGNSKLTSIDIEFPDGTKIKMGKDISVSKIKSPETVITTNELNPVTSSNDRKEQPKETGKAIASPMVGTFYSKSSPTSKPFVEIGSKVKKGDTLCIIEAMKLMNEIESEYDGVVAQILVRDEEMVDFGKKLFVIK